MQEELLCRILQRHAAVVINGKKASVGIGEPGKGLFQERVRDGGREACEQQVQIEARVTGRMAINHIIPAALAYQTKLLKNIDLMKDVYGDSFKDMAAVSMGFVTKISELVNLLKKQVDDMVEARKVANKIEGEYEKAMAYHEIAESLFPLRKTIDKLEEVVDNDMWPLPKYRELLFIN